jgi:hypothetical protein
VKLTRYHPPIRRLQEEFAARIARRRYTRGNGPRSPKLALGDNSEPWIAHPDSVADCIEISNRVKESAARWQSRFKGS